MVRISFLVFLLTGCSGLTESDCLQADYFQIGLEEGKQGNLANRISIYQKYCSEYALSADTEQYYKGREIGLKTFCSPNNGSL